MRLLGADKDEMVQFPPGAECDPERYLLVDQYGNSFPSSQPRVNIPRLFSVQVQDGLPQKDAQGNWVEDTPPPFDSLMVTAREGLQYRIRGQSNVRQRVIWDGCKFVFLADDTELTLDNLTYIGPTHGYCDTFEAVWVKLPDGTITPGYRSKPSMPPGIMMMWGGAKNILPAGWIICEGQSLAKSVYVDLFTAWGYKWGGSGTTFNAPDARGLYPRFVDDGAGEDPNASARTSKYTGGATGDNVGSYGKGTNSTAALYDFGVFLIAFAGCVKTT